MSTPTLISHHQENLKGQIDFAIISIREDEFDAVLTRLPPNFLYQGSNRLYSIHRMSLRNGQDYSIAAVRSVAQGGSAAQKLTEDIIADLAPRQILLVGIGGGVPASEWTLGDVVVATRLQDFSVQARKQGGETEYAVAGGGMHPKVQSVLAALPAMKQALGAWNTLDSIGLPQPKVELEDGNFYGSPEWQLKVRASLQKHFGEENPSRIPKVTAGAVASSDALIKDTDLLAQWQHSSRQITAVEMELAGVYAACWRPDGQIPIVAIRGLSDIVGFVRCDEWTAFACESAAAFAKALLETGFLEVAISKTAVCLLP